MAIRFLVLSDTHDSAFPEPSSLPRVDVVLHCGDLTMIGGLSNYRAAIKSLAQCDAELELVIPGNRDVSLESRWWAENLDGDDDDPDEPKKARELFSEAAHSLSGIVLLTEGTHSFTLNDERTFTIYASPYTPEFGGYAFAYGPDEDRFSAGENPIPDNVDIVMTHGPPAAIKEKY